MKTYSVSTHEKQDVYNEHHAICFCGEIKKISVLLGKKTESYLEICVVLFSLNR